MKATFEHMDLVYEIIFSEPSFDLPERGVALLKAVHENMNPVFPIPSSDMQILGGNTLSDVCVRVSMFNGSAKVEVTTEKCSISFAGLGNNHLELCKTCISLIEQAIRNTLPSLKFKTAAIRPTLFLALGDGTEDASSYLANLLDSSSLPGSDNFNGATLHPGINLEAENEKEYWNIILNVFRNREKASSLVVSCSALYDEQGAFQGLESQTEHLKHLVNTFLGKIDLDVSGLYLEES